MKSSNLRQKLLKKKLFGWVAFLLLLYTIADSSVLEYYCGNENLGIASYTQVLTGHQKSTATSEVVFAAAFRQSSTEQVPDAPAQCSECLCSCTHVIVSSYYYDQVKQSIIYDQQTFFLPKSLQSESHLPTVLRPPRAV